MKLTACVRCIDRADAGIYNNAMKTNYPIVLVHGLGIKDMLWLKAFGKIDRVLKMQGYTVYTSKIDAFGTIEGNAAQLRDEILQILEAEHADKVNLIAHSKGGLDAKYMLANEGMAHCVASLTTLCTPHRGSPIASFILRFPSALVKYAAFWVNLLYRMLGDKAPDAYTACRQLKRVAHVEYEALCRINGILSRSAHYGLQTFNRKDNAAHLMTIDAECYHYCKMHRSLLFEILSRRYFMNKNELIQAFRRIGIREDSCFIVHSSLKSFGHVDGGAETVVEALLQTAPKGTIVMPSFNHGVPYEQGQCFDIRSTPTINGAIPEAFRKRADVLRSMDPTHSYAVCGKDAREIVLLHEKSDTMGIGSPLDYLYKHNGFVLLLGVDFRRNTFHHYVETVTNAPCLRGKGEAYDVIDANGEHKTACTWSWRESDCPIDDPGTYASLMEKYTQTQYIGSCKAMWFAMSDCFNVVRDALQNGMDGHSPCSECTVRPRVCQYTI